MTEPSDLERELVPAELPNFFEEFFKERQKRFLSYALSTLRDRRDAEEAVMQAGEKMYAKWERIMAHPNPEAFAYTILHGVVIDYYRRALRHVEDPVAEPPNVDYLQRLRERQPVDALLAQLEKTSPVQAACVRLKYLSRMSYADVGAALNITPGTAKTNAHKGIAKLKTLMARPPRAEGGA
ncbi:sigma-70 family RNA polymerase sigma factor [Streptantibioticus parmotrematis]|uniref:RNA polymerase sigma factor n=1 Tax=Streptantibioticus parmotrematis TaxID=2873249 RepID=UPI0033C78708